MYFKKNRGSMAEKDPPLGRIDMFQTSSNKNPLRWMYANVQFRRDFLL